MWSHGMTTQESKIEEWQTSFQSNPILDGSTNNILKVEGVNGASVKDVSSEMPRDFRFEERISDPYWLRPASKLAEENFSLRFFSKDVA
jgi:hypothetical protein